MDAPVENTVGTRLFTFQDLVQVHRKGEWVTLFGGSDPAQSRVVFEEFLRSTRGPMRLVLDGLVVRQV